MSEAKALQTLTVMANRSVSKRAAETSLSAIKQTALHSGWAVTAVFTIVLFATAAVLGFGHAERLLIRGQKSLPSVRAWCCW